MAFKNDNWLIGVDRRLLCSITLSDPDSRRDTNYTTNPGASPTLYFCDRPQEQGAFTYGGATYTPTIMSWSGSAASVDFVGGSSDADGTLVLANTRYPFQKKNATAAAETSIWDVKLSQLFASYMWSSATVTLTCYVNRAGTETTQTVFSGVVFDVATTPETLTVRCIQDKKAIRLKPDVEGPGSSSYPSIVTRVGYSTAPDESIGRVIPMPYSHPIVGPLIESQYGLCVNPQNLLGAYQPVAYAERYDGTYVGRYLLGAYPTQTAPGSGSTEMLMWIDDIGTFSVFTSAGVVYTRNATETYASLSSSSTADLYINPNDFVAGTTGVTDPGKAFDGRDDSYAQVAYSGAARQLDLRIPYVGPYGRITGSYAWVLLAAGGTGVGGTDATVNGTFGMWNADAGPAAYHNAVSGNLTKANIRDGGYVEVDLTATTYNHTSWQGWKWEGLTAGNLRQDIYWRIDITSSGATARVLACGLKVRYIPREIFGRTGSSTSRTLKNRDGGQTGRSYK